MCVQAFVQVQYGLCLGRQGTSWVTWEQIPACSIKLEVKGEPAVLGQTLQVPI